MKYLDIKIYPSQSLSKKGLVILMLSFLFIAFLIGSYFSIKGAWPVAGFLGLEILLLYFAFLISFSSNDIYEQIVLDEKSLKIKFHEKNKLLKTIILEPTWLKVSIDDYLNYRNVLTINSHGKKNIIGKFLSPQEKIIIAKKISHSLLKWKDFKG